MIPAYNNLQHLFFVAPRYGPSPRFQSLHSEQDWASEKTCPNVLPLEWSQVQKDTWTMETRPWRDIPWNSGWQLGILIMVCSNPYINWARFHPVAIQQITRVLVTAHIDKPKMQNQKMEARREYVQKNTPTNKSPPTPPMSFAFFFLRKRVLFPYESRPNMWFSAGTRLKSSQMGWGIWHGLFHF